MGFLRTAAREEDANSESDGLEEQYMRLFPKIGRDFVHKDDLATIVQTLMALLDPLDLNPINIFDDSEARARAKEYKTFLDQGQNGSDVYRDLIDLEEDD